MQQRVRNTKFKPTAVITQALLHEYFDYNAETGWLIWKKKPSQGTAIGTRAGVANSNDGYRRIRIKDHSLLEHRVIWYYIHGVWPKDREIDHINRIRNDNRLSNLRQGTVSQNRANRAQRNKLGIRNVYQTKTGRFVVYMTLGSYDTKTEAAKVAHEAAKKLYGEYVNSEAYGM